MTQKEIITAQSQFVAMRNELIQKSRYQLTKQEQKIILFMVSKITPYDEPGTEYPFSFAEFETVCNLNREGGKEKIRIGEALRALKTKPLEIRLSEKKRVITSWFNEAVIDDETQEVKISFSKYLVPYLYNLQSFYTQFSLSNVLPMRSKYSIRLYEYLKSVKSKGHKQTFSVEEIKERVGSENYDKYKDFRVRVLERAVEEINTYSDLMVSYKEIKTGRRVTHIEFTIIANDTAEKHIERMKALGTYPNSK